MSLPNFTAIKAHYQSISEHIDASARDRFAVDPYAWEGLVCLTPIERALWNDIRDIGIVMYPQYPVGRFFTDFANPKAKVAIECDGAAFHQDKQADRARQNEIEVLGWTVYRFTGRQCKELGEDEDRPDASTRQRLLAIAAVHRIAPGVRAATDGQQIDLMTGELT